MKLPILGVHVVTSKRMEQIKKAARAEGVVEGKRFSDTQISVLLGKRQMKPIRIRPRKVSKNDK